VRALVLALLLFSPLLKAGIEARDFASPEEKARYLHFTAELRCPKCQNQNLADSNAPIAADLREQLYRLLREGRSDEEIVDFMVSRYGEYVLYKPRVEPRTWLLWGGPFLMLGIGALVAMLMVRRARERAAGAPVLDDEERARLAGILGEERPG
jgi:cytochrome c-type biogenesis protein CcmH